MYEVEVKVRADHDAVRERLEALGAEHVGSVRQEDTYYDAPHRDFAETDEALRLRRESRQNDDRDAETRLTYKGPLLEAESKSREEHETGVEAGDTAAAIVESVGFEPAAVVSKERDRYAIEGFTVTLDSVESVGEFVEVETEVDHEDAVETAREAAMDLLERLGLDPDEQIQTSYLGLLLSGDAQQ